MPSHPDRVRRNYEEDFKCQYCDLKFKNDSERKIHIILRHRVVNDERRDT